MKHTWGPDHRSKFDRRINVCARCGLVREKLWSYSDDGMRVAYRQKDGTPAGIRAPECQATTTERKDDEKIDA